MVGKSYLASGKSSPVLHSTGCKSEVFMAAANSEHCKVLAKAGMLLSEQSGLKLVFKNQCMVPRIPTARKTGHCLQWVLVEKNIRNYGQLDLKTKGRKGGGYNKKSGFGGSEALWVPSMGVDHCQHFLRRFSKEEGKQQVWKHWNAGAVHVVTLASNTFPSWVISQWTWQWNVPTKACSSTRGSAARLPRASSWRSRSTPSSSGAAWSLPRRGWLETPLMPELNKGPR